MAKIKTQENVYNGVKCLRVYNDKIELQIALDFGIRILKFALTGGENVLYENTADYTPENSDSYKFYGGHRLWHTPEDSERTYLPDNAPVSYYLEKDVVTVVQPVDGSGVKKSIALTLNDNKATIRHELENAGMWDIETAAWAVTQLVPGGVAVYPQAEFDTGLLPNRKFIIWPYTDMSSGAVYLGRKYAAVNNNINAKPVKIGGNAEGGFGAYFNKNTLFVKKFFCDGEEEYPDFGCNVEIYSCDRFLELETLSPVCLMERGDSIEHYEEWELYSGVEAPDMRDEDRMSEIFSEGKLI